MLGKKTSTSWKIFSVVFLLAVTAKQLLWVASVPMWEAPDEQAHVARLNYRLVEKDATPTKPLDNTSEEIVLSERFLGTERNDFGNNQFTYRPQYRLEYTKSLVGKFENVIQNQSQSTRTKMVKNEAAGYPPLYYDISQPIYSLLFGNGLIDRVFAMRFVSVILYLITIVVAFYVGKLVWGKNNLAIITASLVAFQPMVSFVASGYHPDNLLNLLTSLLILCAVSLIKNGFKWKYLVACLILTYLGIETKQFMFFVFPAVLSICAFTFFKSTPMKLLSAAVTLAFPVVCFLTLLPIPNMPRVTPESPLFSLSLIDYLKFRLPRLVFEMHPWYWGVFKWLGVTLDPLVLKVITRTVGLAVLGVIVGLTIRFLKKKFELTEKIVLFFIISTISYVVYLFLWDWRLMQVNGFSLGLQGRYLLPLVVVHMTLLLYGLTNLFPVRVKNIAFFATAAGMITLNLVAFPTVIRSYYSVSSFETFITQASQYKPAIFKGDNLMFLIFVTVLLLSVYLLLVFKRLVLNQDEQKTPDR